MTDAPPPGPPDRPGPAAGRTTVSFVIPTRNQAPFIRRCLDSCLAQRAPGGEVIVVDGLSTDGTQEVLASYGDRIRWTSEADSGQSEAVNKGVARARGDVIAWVNSDDFYVDDAVVRAVLATFDEDPRVDVVYGDGLFVDAEGRTFRRCRARPIRAAKDLLVGATGPLQPAVFFRRQLFLDVGGLATRLHYAMDYDLWLRLFPAAREVRRLARPLACATFHRGAKTITSMLAMVRELGAVKAAHRDRFDLSLADRGRLAAGVASLYAYWAAVRLGLRRAA